MDTKRCRTLLAWMGGEEATGGRERLFIWGEGGSLRAYDVDGVACVVDLDDAEAELRAVVAPELRGGVGTIKLGIVVTHKGDGGHRVAVGRCVAVVKEVVDVGGKERLDTRLLQQAKQPGAARLVDVVVMARFVGRGQVDGVVCEKEGALSSMGG